MLFFWNFISVFFSFSLGSPSPSLNSSVASSPALAATVVEATEDTTDASINDSDPQGGAEINPHYVEPALYSWFYKFRQALLSKVTVFFYDVLKRYHNEESMREFCSKIHNDIAGQ